eukprot:2843479-Prymnesium_polylepis.1
MLYKLESTTVISPRATRLSGYSTLRTHTAVSYTLSVRPLPRPHVAAFHASRSTERRAADTIEARARPRAPREPRALGAAGGPRAASA